MHSSEDGQNCDFSRHRARWCGDDDAKILHVEDSEEQPEWESQCYLTRYLICCAESQWHRVLAAVWPLSIFPAFTILWANIPKHHHRAEVHLLPRRCRSREVHCLAFVCTRVTTPYMLANHVVIMIIFLQGSENFTKTHNQEPFRAQLRLTTQQLRCAPFCVSLGVKVDFSPNSGNITHRLTVWTVKACRIGTHARPAARVGVWRTPSNGLALRSGHRLHVLAWEASKEQLETIGGRALCISSDEGSLLPAEPAGSVLACWLVALRRWGTAWVVRGQVRDFAENGARKTLSFCDSSH